MYSAYFYNFGYTKWFDTREQAEACGRESGFQCIIVEELQK